MLLHLPNGSTRVECAEAACTHKVILPQATFACFEYKRRLL